MAIVDIRNSVVGVDEIVFDSDEGSDFFIATSLKHNSNRYIRVQDGDGTTVLIQKSSINNLIKALQKAQEIWKED